MPSTTEITVPQLSRLIGLPDSPAIVDIRSDEDFAADSRLIPGSQGREFSSVEAWGADYHGQQAIVSCQNGLQLSQGVAARMRCQANAARRRLRSLARERPTAPSHGEAAAA